MYLLEVLSQENGTYVYINKNIVWLLRNESTIGKVNNKLDNMIFAFYNMILLLLNRIAMTIKDGRFQ